MNYLSSGLGVLVALLVIFVIYKNNQLNKCRQALDILRRESVS